MDEKYLLMFEHFFNEITSVKRRDRLQMKMSYSAVVRRYWRNTPNKWRSNLRAILGTCSGNLIGERRGVSIIFQVKL